MFITSGAANKAPAYVGPYAASKAALEALVRVWANETATTPLRVNLFSPGPIRTRMRAAVFPGEDPMTLDTPEQAAEFIVPMCEPSWTETGKFYDYKSRTLMSFPPAGVERSSLRHCEERELRSNPVSLCSPGLLRFARNDGPHAIDFALAAIDCPPKRENPSRKIREECHDADAPSRALDTCHPPFHQNHCRLLSPSPC